MPNDPNPDGITPFEHARENDFEEIKAILIPFLANVDENDIDELEILDDMTRVAKCFEFKSAWIWVLLSKKCQNCGAFWHLSK